MTELTMTANDDTGEVILHGEETGPAGGAILVPAPSLELLFDRVTGRLCRLTAEVPGPGGGMDDDELSARRILILLFGTVGSRAILRPVAGPIGQTVKPRPESCAALSLLARLDAARATSPIPASSPLWAAEAAVLAERAGMTRRARAEARLAIPGLVQIMTDIPLPAALSGPVRQVARLAETDVPDAAQMLTDGSIGWFGGSFDEWLAEFGSRPSIGPRLPGQYPTSCPYHRLGPRRALDLSLLPAGLLLPGLTPSSDLILYRALPDLLAVEVWLSPTADEAALSRCAVRLVDPGARRVTAQAPLIREHGRARAILRLPPDSRAADDLAGRWLEVVGDANRPVRSETLRRRRQALRWADAGQRAERRPRGLAPDLTDGEWLATAVTAWEHCRRYWLSCGDPRRAGAAAAFSGRPELAVMIAPAGGPEASGLRPATPGYLAETLGLVPT